MSAARFRVRGRVQGVGCRMWAADTAGGIGIGIGIGVRGWVRNLFDGSVEAHAEGPDTQVDRFAGALAGGSPSARAEGIDRVQAETSGATGFSVR